MGRKKRQPIVATISLRLKLGQIHGVRASGLAQTVQLVVKNHDVQLADGAEYELQTYILGKKKGGVTECR